MNQHQHDTLAILAEVWALSPEVRLGQLMAHLGFLGEAYSSRGLADLDDDELLSVMNKHLNELESRKKSESNCNSFNEVA